MNAPERGIACPFCGSREVELVSPWGGQLITSQLRCRSCNTHFEAVRDDFDGRAAPA
jgi:DNA-directed RNA polymerase subunit RPC12/RpoP